MYQEEEELARLSAGKAEFDASEITRHARYVAEDAEIAARRAREDDLHAQGVALRESREAELEAALAKRKAADAAMDPATIEALMARIAHLEAESQKPADEPAADADTSKSSKSSK